MVDSGRRKVIVLAPCVQAKEEHTDAFGPTIGPVPLTEFISVDLPAWGVDTEQCTPAGVDIMQGIGADLRQRFMRRGTSVAVVTDATGKGESSAVALARGLSQNVTLSFSRTPFNTLSGEPDEQCTQSAHVAQADIDMNTIAMPAILTSEDPTDRVRWLDRLFGVGRASTPLVAESGKPLDRSGEERCQGLAVGIGGDVYQARNCEGSAVVKALATTTFNAFVSGTGFVNATFDDLAKLLAWRDTWESRVMAREQQALRNTRLLYEVFDKLRGGEPGRPTGSGTGNARGEDTSMGTDTVVTDRFSAVQNLGMQCWGICGHHSGACPNFCGEQGACCRKGFPDSLGNTACGYGTLGGAHDHMCVASASSMPSLSSRAPAGRLLQNAASSIRSPSSQVGTAGGAADEATIFIGSEGHVRGLRHLLGLQWSAPPYVSRTVESDPDLAIVPTPPGSGLLFDLDVVNNTLDVSFVYPVYLSGKPDAPTANRSGVLEASPILRAIELERLWDEHAKVAITRYSESVGKCYERVRHHICETTDRCECYFAFDQSSPQRCVSPSPPPPTTFASPPPPDPPLPPRTPLSPPLPPMPLPPLAPPAAPPPAAPPPATPLALPAPPLAFGRALLYVGSGLCMGLALLALAAWVVRRLQKRRMRVASLHGMGPMWRASAPDSESLVAASLQPMPWFTSRLQHFMGMSLYEHELSDATMAARTVAARRQEGEATVEGVAPEAATSTQGMHSTPSIVPAWSPWGPTPSGRGPPPIRRLQVSFASADMHHVTMYRDMVDRFTDGWATVELQRPGIRDTAWVDMWKRGLDASSGCLIVFSHHYVSRVASSMRDSPLLLEARYISRRVQRDRSFKLFVLNPELTGQDYANLKFYLDQDDPGMNCELWLDFLQNRRSTLSPNVLSVQGHRRHHGRVASDGSTGARASSTEGAAQAE